MRRRCRASQVVNLVHLELLFYVWWGTKTNQRKKKKKKTKYQDRGGERRRGGRGISQAGKRGGAVGSRGGRRERVWLTESYTSLLTHARAYGHKSAREQKEEQQTYTQAHTADLDWFHDIMGHKVEAWVSYPVLNILLPDGRGDRPSSCRGKSFVGDRVAAIIHPCVRSQRSQYLRAT